MTNLSENRSKGNTGEAIAVAYLQNNSFKILARNYSSKLNFHGGEIDIIAEKEKIIHFIEVKMRSSNLFGSGRESVTKSKQKIIRRIATRYLVENKLWNSVECCFDVVEIQNAFGSQQIDFLENCF